MAEREETKWRQETGDRGASPASRSLFSSSLVSCLLVFALALVPRIAGLRWGLPNAEHWYSYHPDERQIVEAVAQLDFLGGDFNPNFFNYPSLYIYFVAFAYLLQGILGLTQNATGNTLWPLLQDVIVSGRVITALMGALTVPLVFLIARRVGGSAFGMVAALLMAFAPGHVQHSHFATVDVPATFFIALTLYLALLATSQSNHSAQPKYFVWAGVAAGLAAATKYNAVIVLIVPLAALWIERPGNTPKYFGATIAAAFGAFFIGCPFSLLSFSEFWGDGQNTGFGYELLVHPRQGSGEIFQQTGNGWWYHATFNLPFALTAPLAVLSFIGLLLAFRDARSKYFVPLGVFALLYFLAIGTSQVRFLRYTLPLAPVLCIFAALAIEWIAARLTRNEAPSSKYFRGLAAVLVAVVFMGTLNVVWPFISTDPRDAAAQWLRGAAPPGATIALATPPWFWTPPLTPRDSPPPSREIHQPPDGRFQLEVAGFDFAKMLLSRYVVMSEFEWRDKIRLNDPAYRAYGQELASTHFAPQVFRTTVPLELPGREFVPHDFLYSHPQIRVYQRRD
ncbi:MAG: hypothetical protein JWN98_864 [Abditibacteriota bacterium]|nr:hypothetical protein [Abditibacteriota bacterium]